MADNNFDAKPAKARLKPGVLPGVRQIRRPDFSVRAADIEKAEEARAMAETAEAGDAGAADSSALEDAREAAAVAAYKNHLENASKKKGSK